MSILLWILVTLGILMLAYRMYIVYEAARVADAMYELYALLPFEPMLFEEVYEHAKNSEHPNLVRFLNLIPIMRVITLIDIIPASQEERDERFTYASQESLRWLLRMLEESGMAKTTRVPITLAWLEMNKHVLHFVPEDELRKWTKRAFGLDQAPPHDHGPGAKRCVRCRYEKILCYATMVSKRSRGRKQKIKEVLDAKHIPQHA